MKISSLAQNSIYPRNSVSSLVINNSFVNFLESELSKLDSRLVHVLAYQRLQQLVAQTTNKVRCRCLC